MRSWHALRWDRDDFILYCFVSIPIIYPPRRLPCHYPMMQKGRLLPPVFERLRQRLIS
jgi:hypothetical protein